MPEKVGEIKLDRKFAGSIMLTDTEITELTDVTPGTTDEVTLEISDCRHINDLLIDIVIDKGCTVDVARYADKEKTQALKSFTQQTIANGGDSVSYTFEKIACYAVEVTITKSEAGTTDGFVASARGEG